MTTNRDEIRAAAVRELREEPEVREAVALLESIERRPAGDRGLVEYARGMDTYGKAWRVQTSSSAEVDAVFLFTDQVIGQHLGRDNHAALHLGVEGARCLGCALLSWVKDVCESGDG